MFLHMFSWQQDGSRKVSIETKKHTHTCLHILRFLSLFIVLSIPDCVRYIHRSFDCRKALHDSKLLGNTQKEERDTIFRIVAAVLHLGASSMFFVY